MHDVKLTVTILALMVSAFAASPALAAPECDPGNGGITLPKGFCALLAVENIGAARHAVAAPMAIFMSRCAPRAAATAA